ncbi:MAG: hypothetical protein WD404_10190, partial [Solirubrobacterales bacterium]
IISVADTFDALTSERPYRAAMSHREAFALLGSEAAAQLDADAVRAFRSHYGGHRRVAVWAVLVNGGRQLVQPLLGRSGLSAAAGTSKVAAASLATVALSGAALQADDGRRAEAEPFAAEPASGRVVSSARGGADSRDGDGAPRDRRRVGAQDGPRGRAASPADAGDAGLRGDGADSGGDSAGPAPADRPRSSPSPDPSRPKEPEPEPTPVRDAVRTVEETADEVVKVVPPLDPALPEVPAVELPRLPRADDLD